TGVLTLGEVRRVLRTIVVLTLTVEAVATLALALRFATAYDEDPLEALWLGGFHAVSAFNNAGFALWPDSLARFVADPVVNIVVAGAVVFGSLGAPVLGELAVDRFAWRRWSLHTKLTITATVAV